MQVRSDSCRSNPTMRRLVSTLGLCLCLCGGAGGARAQTPPVEWPALVARDARVGFSPRTALLAGDALRSEKASKERRAAAWLALGAIGASDRRAELLEAAKNGSEPERGAAILALG